jgi:hypothetical protein
LLRLRSGAALPDLVVARAAAAPVLLANDGGGVFTPSSLGLPAPPTPVAAVLAGNLDNVAPDDLLVLPEQGRPQLLLGQAAGFRDASSLFAAGLFVQAPVAALADLDVDGDLDIAFGSGAGAAPFWLQNQSGFARQLPLPLNGPQLALAVADFDGDGRPDIAAARAGTPAAIEFAANRTTGFAAHSPAVPFPLDAPAAALQAADVNGDGRLDLVALQVDGRVRVGFGQPGFQFGYPPSPLVEAAPRSALAAGDLEADGDVDLFLAGGAAGRAAVRDSVLLGIGPSGRWLDSEAVGFPIGALPGAGAAAAVDFDADGEPDLVGCAAGGAGFAFRNDGTARFLSAPAVMPDLPVREVRRVLRASVDTPGRDLVVVATPAAGAAQPPGVRLLVAQAGRYADATARLPGAVIQRGFADVALARVLLSTGPRSVDDLVLADLTGQLTVLIHQPGGYLEAPGAFAPAVASAPVRAVVTGDVDGDARSDVVLFEHGSSGGAMQVYLRTAGNAAPLFVLAPAAPAVPGAVDSPLVGDFDGDGTLDIVAAPAGSAAPPLLYLAGDGRGSFADVSASRFSGPLPARITALVAVGAPRQLPAFVLGRGAGEPLLLLRRSGVGFTPPEVQPVQGSPRAVDLVVADFDTDGDDDCAVLAADVAPEVLLGTNVHLAAASAFRAGRLVTIRARGPDPAAIAAWLWSPAGPGRLPVPDLGLVRLLPPIQSLAVFAIGPRLVQDVSFAAPPLAADVILYFQLAVFDPRAAALRLSNLAPARVLSR